MLGSVVPPLTGLKGGLPIANTAVLPVTAEKGVTVTRQEPEVDEYGPTIKVKPVEHGLQEVHAE